VHPRLRPRLEQHTGLRWIEAPAASPLPSTGLFGLEPLGYLDCVALMSKARFVMTDSGGIQEETTMLGVPCLTLRHNTERPVTVTSGTNRIVGTDPGRIVEEALWTLLSPPAPSVPPVLWDGRAASRMRPGDLDTEYLTGARWLHVTGITPALSESCLATVEEAIELGRSAGLEVSFDPNMRLKLWTVEQAREVMFPLIHRSTILLGGMEELSLLLQVDTPDAAADWALEQGLGIAVVKLGADGALVATPSERRTIAPFTISRVVDTVGAGDGFDAGFIAARLLDRDPWQAAELGNVVGAHALMVEGDYEGYPTMAEAEAFIAGRRRVER